VQAGLETGDTADLEICATERIRECVSAFLARLKNGFGDKQLFRFAEKASDATQFVAFMRLLES
jgi:hypothetical protein